MLRKSYVSDMVHSYCYACRAHWDTSPPFVILGWDRHKDTWENGYSFKVPTHETAIAYALKCAISIQEFTSAMWYLTRHSADFSADEFNYMQYLFDTYYTL